MKLKIIICSLFVLLLIGCQTLVPDEQKIGTIVPTPVPATVAQASPTISVTESAPTETPTAVSTSIPTETAAPTALPTETAVSTQSTPQTRQEFFNLLVELNTQVIDDATLLLALLDDTAIEDEAWQDAVLASVTAVQSTTAAVENIEPPQGGINPHAQAVTAMTACNDTATQINTAVASNNSDFLTTVSDELSICIFGLDKLNGSLTRQPTTQDTGEATDAILVGCDGTSTGFVPLTALGTGTYQGVAGGLYPNGENVRPAAHEAAGLALAEQIEPINGQIVLLSLGMSNTRNEFEYFIEAVANDSEVNPAVLPVNGAIPGRPSQTIDSPTAMYWELVDNRLRRAGVTAEDVQVIWLKQAHGYPKRPFPDDALTFETELRNIVQVIQIKYPNVKQVFLSSRIYAGYAVTNLSPEPYAYQAGFGVKWLIEDQLNGDLTNVPWLSWGPYMWADGLTTRADGLRWNCDDFEKDGIHPAPAGREKVAQLLLDFFKNDTATQSWFLDQ